MIAELRRLSVTQVHHELRLVVSEQPLADLASPSPPVGVRIEPFTQSDWSLLAEVARPRTLRRFRERAERGRTCFVAWRGSRPVGYAWLSERTELDLERVALPLPADAAYSWDLYVAPQERNAGVGSALLLARLAGARDRGFRKVWRAVEPRNRPSLRVLEKNAADYRLVGESVYTKTLGRSRVRFEPNNGTLSDRQHTARDVRARRVSPDSR